MDEVAAKDDLEFQKACLKAHGYNSEESDDGKSESDEDLRSMKPPSIPLSKFKNKIVKIGNDSRIKTEKRSNNVLNRESISKDLNKKKNFQLRSVIPEESEYAFTAVTPATIPQSEQLNVLCSRDDFVDDNKCVPSVPWETLSVSIQANSTFAELTRKSTLHSNVLPNNDNVVCDVVSSEVCKEHPTKLNQTLSVWTTKQANSTSSKVRCKATPHHNASLNENNVDHIKLVPSEILVEHIGKSTPFLPVSRAAHTNGAYAKETHKPILQQRNALSNNRRIDFNKSFSSEVYEEHPINSAQTLSVCMPKQVNSSTAKVRRTAPSHQHNLGGNKLVPSEILEEHIGKSTPILPVSRSAHTNSTFAEVTRKSTLHQSNALLNNDSVDRNKSVHSEVYGEHPTNSAQTLAVSIAKQANSTSAKVRREATPHQHNVDGNKLVSSEILEHIGKSTPFLPVSRAAHTNSAYAKETHKPILQQRNALSSNHRIDFNKSFSSEVYEEHLINSAQTLSVSIPKQVNRSTAKVRRTAPPHQHNVDGNKLVSSEIFEERIDKSTPIPPVSWPARTITFAEVTRKLTLRQHNASPNNDIVDSNKPVSSGVYEEHLNKSVQSLSVSLSERTGQTSTKAKRKSTPRQNNAWLNNNNLNDNKLILSKVVEEHAGKPTHKTFAEVTRKSPLPQLDASPNGNNVDDNKLVSSRLYEEHVSIPTQILSVVTSRETNSTSVKPARNTNILVSSEIVVEHAGKPATIISLSRSRETNSSFAEVTRKSTLNQDNALLNKNNAYGNKSVSPRLQGAHTRTSAQLLGGFERLFVLTPTKVYSAVAEVAYASHQRNAFCNEYNMDDSKLVLPRYEEDNSLQTSEYLTQKQQKNNKNKEEEDRELSAIRAKLLGFLCCHIIYQILMRL